MGITHGDHFADMGIGYFTAQEAGAHTFGFTHSDDQSPIVDRLGSGW